MRSIKCSGNKEILVFFEEYTCQTLITWVKDKTGIAFTACAFQPPHMSWLRWFKISIVINLQTEDYHSSNMIVVALSLWSNIFGRIIILILYFGYNRKFFSQQKYRFSLKIKPILQQNYKISGEIFFRDMALIPVIRDLVLGQLKVCQKWQLWWNNSK